MRRHVDADPDLQRRQRAARDAVAVGRLLRYESSAALAAELVDLWNQGWPLTSIDDAPARSASVGEAEVTAVLRTCTRNLVFGLTGDQGVIRAAFAANKPALVPAAGTAPASGTP